MLIVLVISIVYTDTVIAQHELYKHWRLKSAGNLELYSTYFIFGFFWWCTVLWAQIYWIYLKTVTITFYQSVCIKTIKYHAYIASGCYFVPLSLTQKAKLQFTVRIYQFWNYDSLWNMFVACRSKSKTPKWFISSCDRVIGPWVVKMTNCNLRINVNLTGKCNVVKAQDPSLSRNLGKEPKINLCYKVLQNLRLSDLS